MTYRLWLERRKYFDNDPQYLSDSPDRCFSYPIDAVGHGIIEEWHKTLNGQDGNLSGVLADWIEDHRDSMLHGATGPSDPALRLDALIDHLRSRFLASAS